MKNDRVQINLRIPTDIKAWLDKQAEEQERSLTWLVNQAVMEMKQRKEDQDVSQV